MAAASWVMASPARYRAGQRAGAGPAARPGRPDPAAAAAAVGVDRGPGRTGPAGPDVPRVVAGRARRPSAVSARDEVLGRIRVALGRDGAAGGPDSSRTAAYRTHGPADPAHLLDLLAERLADYRATVRRAQPDQVLPTIIAALAERGARRVVRPPGLDLPGWPATVELVTDDGSCPPGTWTPSTG